MVLVDGHQLSQNFHKQLAMRSTPNCPSTSAQSIT